MCCGVIGEGVVRGDLDCFFFFFFLFLGGEGGFG